MTASQPQDRRGTGAAPASRPAQDPPRADPEIGPAGACPARANDSLPQDPEVPTDVDPGDERSWSGDDVDDPGAEPGAGASGTGR